MLGIINEIVFRQLLTSALYLSRRYIIDSPSSGIVALERVAIRQAPTRLHNRDAATALSGQPISIVLDFHHLVSELALKKIEVEAIKTDQFGQQLIFKHVFAFETIPEHKTAHFVCMSVQIHKHVQVFKLVLLHNGFFHCEDRGLVLWRRALVVSIQILA